MIDIKNVSKQLGLRFKKEVEQYRADPTQFSDLKEVMIRSFQTNGWYTEKSILTAMEQWSLALQSDMLSNG